MSINFIQLLDMVPIFQAVFEHAAKIPFIYLLTDLRKQSDEGMWLRMHILPNQTQYVYQPKLKQV